MNHKKDMEIVPIAKSMPGAVEPTIAQNENRIVGVVTQIDVRSPCVDIMDEMGHLVERHYQYTIAYCSIETTADGPEIKNLPVASPDLRCGDYVEVVVRRLPRPPK